MWVTMKISLNGTQMQALLDFCKASDDAEQLSEDTYNLDIFELEPPISVEFELIDGGIDALSAFELKYDPSQDGWYLGDKLEDADALKKKLLNWQLLQ